MVPETRQAHDWAMEMIVLIMVPFGSVALLAVAGAASALTKAVAAEDILRRTELWILFALLTLLAGFCMLGAWWWWQGWQDFSF